MQNTPIINGKTKILTTLFIIGIIHKILQHTMVVHSGKLGLDFSLFKRSFWEKGCEQQEIHQQLSCWGSFSVFLTKSFFRQWVADRRI